MITRHTIFRILVICMFFLNLTVLLSGCGGGGGGDDAATAPTAPTGVTVTAADGQVTVSWTAVSNATSYNIYWKTSAGVTTADTKITGAASPYQHTGLTNGTACYYAVTAVNDAGESPLSSEVSATPQVAIPGVPSNVTITAGNGANAISWSAVAGASSYNIYWGTAPGVTTSSTKITGAVSPYTHTPITNWVSYYYRVTAVNAGGESTLSAEVSGMPKMPAGVFIKYVAHTGMASNSTVLFGTADEMRYMMLYLSENMNSAGVINSISFKRDGALASAVTCTSVTIKMGHTVVSSLTTTYADNVEQGQGSLQTMLSNAAITIPAGGAGEYFSISLSQPFIYNGVDNLIVDVSRLAACSAVVQTAYHLASPAYNGLTYKAGPGSSSSLTGSTYNLVFDTKFNFAGGDDAVLYSGGGNAYPLTTSAVGQKVQLLYPSSQINGSGYLTGIGFPLGSLSTDQTYTVTIRLGHSTLTNLGTSSWDANFNSGAPVNVASGLAFKIPAGIPAGGYVWLPVTNTFYYNGSDNLVAEIEVTGATGNTTWRTDSSAGNVTRVFGSSGSSAPSTTSSEKYDIKFRFYGGTVDVITAGTYTTPLPFYNANNTRLQHLYHASELGAQGTITKVACRLQDINSFASDYNSFAVVLSHTTGTILGTSFSANMPSPQTVYNATFSVPAGLKAGDWIEIPLSTPFAYNPTKNLVVEMSSLAGTALNNIVTEQNATQFPSREARAWSNTTDTASVFNVLADLRLELVQ